MSHMEIGQKLYLCGNDTQHVHSVAHGRAFYPPPWQLKSFWKDLQGWHTTSLWALIVADLRLSLGV